MSNRCSYRKVSLPRYCQHVWRRRRSVFAGSYISCFDSDTQSASCNTPNIFTKNEEIKVRLMQLAMEKYCVKMSSSDWLTRLAAASPPVGVQEHSQ